MLRVPAQGKDCPMDQVSPAQNPFPIGIPRMPGGLHAVNVGTRLVLSGPDPRREGLQPTRPEHPCVCPSQAAGPDPVRSVDGRIATAHERH